MKRITQIIATLVAVLFTLTANAQQADFSGTWKLTDNKGISGTVYANAVPQQIKIAQTKELLVLETTEEKQFPTDIVGIEKLPINGKPVDTALGKKQRKRTVKAMFDKAGSICTRTSSLYEEDGKTIYATYTDVFSLDGGNLALKRKGENLSNGEVWECESTYEKQPL